MKISKTAYDDAFRTYQRVQKGVEMLCAEKYVV